MGPLLVLIALVSTGARAAKLNAVELPLAFGFLEVSDDAKGKHGYVATSERFDTLEISTSPGAHQHTLGACSLAPRSKQYGNLFHFELDSDWNKQHGQHRILDDETKTRVITIWSDCGFESIREPVVVWEKDGSTLKDEIVLDHALSSGIGASSIAEIHKVGKGRHLLIGRSEGGDGGETWGDIYVSLWTEPRHLETIYVTSYSGSEEMGSRVDYSFDESTLSMHFKKRTGSMEKPFSEWKEESSWTVNLKEKIGN
jgi:hypothetical protein